MMKKKLSYAMKLDKEGNIQATDNKGNKLKPCSPEEMIKKIVQNFKSQMPKALSSNTIQIRIKNQMNGLQAFSPENAL